MKKRKRLLLLGDIIGMVSAIVIFVFPFLFMFINSLKDRREANLLSMALPKEFLWENYKKVFEANNYIVLTAFKNSFLLTILSVLGLIIVCSMAGYVLQRRKDRTMSIVNFVIMTGLMIPPAILPTIWVMQGLHVYRTLFGMVMVEIPLLKPVTATVVILNAVGIFNDFTNPLYFLPGSKNATVQLTLYNFMGQYSNSYNLLFADVILITVPMLIVFIIFNKRIVDGMVAGSVKG